MIRFFFGIIGVIPLIISAAACSGVVIEPPPPSPTIIQVGLTPTLNHILSEQFDFCEQEITGLEILLKAVPHQSLDLDQVDLLVDIPISEDGWTDYVFKIGELDIVMISHPENDIASLNISLIRKYYASTAPSISIWAYPENNDLRIMFDKFILEVDGVSPNVMIAPNPEEMVEAVASKAGSIGYIPKQWVTSEVKILFLESEQDAVIIQPILAFSRSEPQGLTKELLACLQNYQP